MTPGLEPTRPTRTELLARKQQLEQGLDCGYSRPVSLALDAVVTAAEEAGA